MLVLFSKEKLLQFLQEELKCWESVGGGPNINAFSFDPKTTDPAILRQHGYYENREAWIAGVRIKELHHLINELDSLPQYKK